VRAAPASQEIGAPTAAAAVLREAFPEGFDAPEVYLVLGSGLSSLKTSVEHGVAVPFSALPGFPAAGIAGHRGEFVIGRLAGRRALVQAGRVHLYEGHPVSTVVAGVRVAAALGRPVAIFTNAAGGIDRRLAPGDLMLLDDHINLTGRSALAGPVSSGEERFPDMSRPYDAEFQALVSMEAARLGIPLSRGVYLGLLGPSYETPAEIRMAAGLGADAVGMSTVLEVITARANGLRCLGFSMITNAAAGLGSGVLDHSDVLEVGARAGARLEQLLLGVLPKLL